MNDDTGKRLPNHSTGRDAKVGQSALDGNGLNEATVPAPVEPTAGYWRGRACMADDLTVAYKAGMHAPEFGEPAKVTAEMLEGALKAKPLDPAIRKVIHDHFWELIDASNQPSEGASETPETDAFAKIPSEEQSTAGIAADWAKFARTLERQRNALLASIEPMHRQYHALHDEVEEARARVLELEPMVDELREKLAAACRAYDGLRDGAEKRIGELQQKLEAAEQNYATQERAIEAAERDYTQCKVALDDERTVHGHAIASLKRAASEEIQAANKRAEAAERALQDRLSATYVSEREKLADEKRKEVERELADKDTVRSLYDAYNQDWLKALDEFAEVRGIAKSEIDRLEQRNVALSRELTERHTIALQQTTQIRELEQRTAELARQLAHAEEAERDALEQFKRAMGEQAALAERVRGACANLAGSFLRPHGPHTKEYATACADLQDAIRTLDLSALTEEPRT